MARSTDAQKAERLNAAHNLLARGTGMREAVVSLSRQFEIPTTTGVSLSAGSRDDRPSGARRCAIGANHTQDTGQHRGRGASVFGDQRIGAQRERHAGDHRTDRRMRGMADRRSRRDRYKVHLDYAGDRLHASKLQQVYERLVPDQARIAGEGSKTMESDNADGGNLCAGVVGQAAGGESTISGSQTAALIEFSPGRQLQVPAEWVFEDEGYSGASLVRPGLERLRDLAAEGQIEAVLVHTAPDRLSRKYAYQILLIEELGRHGVETIFLKARLKARRRRINCWVQFQGMIAEYERAQILERSRRGKRHRARQGQINVLSGAPYGYRYVRKSDDAGARP